MKKRIIALLLCLLMLTLCACGEKKGESLSDLPVVPEKTSVPAESGVCGDYMYDFYADGTAVITRYSGKEENVVIPAELDGHRVTAIGYEAFDSFYINTVTIPDGVTCIKSMAFFYCSKLTSVEIPDSVVSVGDEPFFCCGNLKEIKVSADHPVLAAVDGVLFDKTEKRLITCPKSLKLTEYMIPQGIRIIGTGAFRDNDSLASVIIPDSVTDIGWLAFCGCDALTSVSLPDSITSVGANPFANCRQLEKITVSVDHPVLAVIDGVLFDKKEKRLITYPCSFAETEYMIPRGIKIIGDCAFECNNSLISVIIPDSVSDIRSCAFSSCESLTTVTIPGSVNTIRNQAFYGCTSLASVTIPDSLTDIQEDVFLECSPSLTVTVGRNSFARQYCIDNGISYTYADALDWLND